ncbi:MAG: HAMP domain-containing protein, partial [Candidatus Omnitrophica bacterium]|nr:HAMP domain-containing protein [Candidatus Omnitrophota bacterium]
MGKHVAFKAFRKKLWISIFLLVASLIAISMITISVFLLEKLHDTMQQDFEERGLILAREFSQRIAEDLMIEDTIHLKKQLSQLFVKDELLYAVLYEGKGLRLLHKSTLEDDDQSFFLKGLKPELKTRRLSIGAETKIKTLDICVPIHYEKDIIGWLQLGISLERIDTEVKKRIINLSLFVIGLILFGLFASFIFARSLTKPINKLLIGVNRIGQGDLSYKVDLQRVDEIGALASAINNMSNELQQKTTSIDKLNQVIKEREEAEDHLRQSQKMEAIGTLAGGVAHDLNNILGGLVSYPELLLLQLPEDNPLRESILIIKKSGEKAAAVVKDLLTLARRGVVVTEVVNLNDVIADYLKSPEHENLQLYHPGVHLEIHLAIDTLNILGSSTHLSKTVMNLVSNAAESMPEGGKMAISTENRYIDRP